MSYIQGSDRTQSVLFPPRMDDFVTEDNPVRFIEGFVERLNMEELGFIRAIPAETGRPGYDPKDLLKLFIYGYLYKIRSSRKLEKESHRNVELMWLLRNLKPDFKTIADFRKDNKKGISGVFREFLLLCKEMKLFGCELIGIDGSKFKGVNSESRNYTRKRLEYLVNQINERIDRYLKVLDNQDQKEAQVGTLTKAELEEKLAGMEEKRSQLAAVQKRLDEGDAEQVSLTDPDARAMVGRQGRTVGYNVQIGVDSTHKLLVAAEVCQDRCDTHQLLSMSRKVKENLDIESCEVVADKGYYRHEELGKCLEEGVTPRVPPKRDSRYSALGLYTKSDFVYDEKNDQYTCPAGNQLKPAKKRKKTKGPTYYRTKACQACALKKECTQSKKGRTLMRSFYENQIDKLEREGAKEGYFQKLRRNLVEHPFGTIKTSFQFGTFLTKGLENVQTEITLTALAYNLRRMLNLGETKGLILEA